MTKAFNFTCEGESHKALNKACQDYSLTSSDEGLTIAVVCDGHGGERYFRSDIGSKYAAEVTLELITVFINNIDDDLFVNKPYTAMGPSTSIVDAEHFSDVDKAFRRLFSSIIYKWNERIESHAKSNDLTEWEKEHVPAKYLDEFVAADSYEKYYGCTLMAYVQTPNYWFAFHIGDGKCISFQKDPIWMEPIPWDDKCFLNKTTSLCDSSALEEFRYCYQGNGDFPIAIFLGSDGIDDSFGEDENLVNFYIQILKMLVNDGEEATIHSIETELPQLSAIGSKDDMSIATVYDSDLLQKHVETLIQYQINIVQDQIHQLDTRIDLLTQKLRFFEVQEVLDEKSLIEERYARQDIEHTNEERRKLCLRLEKLSNQLTPSSKSD